MRPVQIAEGDWLEVWQDRGRARVGYRDGTVYALPSAVKIAPPTGSPVVDYAHYCEHTYALTASALLRLDPEDGSPIGKWTALDPPRGSGLSRLWRDLNGALWVFSSDGTAQSLNAQACAP